MHGDVWQYMAMHGDVWQYMAMHGDAWRCMVMHGDAWRCMAMHGDVWQYMAMHGDVWQCMAMYGHTLFGSLNSSEARAVALFSSFPLFLFSSFPLSFFPKHANAEWSREVRRASHWTAVKQQHPLPQPSLQIPLVVSRRSAVSMLRDFVKKKRHSAVASTLFESLSISATYTSVCGV